MLKLKRVILVGGGGHCKVIIDAIRKSDGLEILGVVDKNPALKSVLGIKVIGKDRDLSAIFKSGCKHAFISIGSIGDVSIRVKIARELTKIGFYLPVIKHPSSVIAEGITVDEGTFIAAGVIIGPGVKIGKNVIINTGSVIDHDCSISDFVHIAPRVILNGSVKVGEKTHIGTGTSIIERRGIGHATIIGAGSVVVSDIPANSKAFGNPCKVVSKI